MHYRVLLIAAVLCLPLAACMHNTKPQTSDARCPRLLAQAQKLYASHAHQREKQVAAQAANLITAAKIAREHHEYITCLDKASRAIELLDPNSVMNIQSGQ